MSLANRVLARQRAHAHRLHGLMAALVVFKALTLLSQAGMYQLIRSTGHPEGWNVAFYVFNLQRGVLFFTVSPVIKRWSLQGALTQQLRAVSVNSARQDLFYVVFPESDTETAYIRLRGCRRMQVIVLVGTGWSYMTPFLRDREKRILMVVIPLQVSMLTNNCQAGRYCFAALQSVVCSTAPLASVEIRAGHTLLCTVSCILSLSLQPGSLIAVPNVRYWTAKDPPVKAHVEIGVC